MEPGTSDTLGRTDEAFARNRLLATFPAEARALIEPHGSVVDFDLGSVIHASGAEVDHSYFPFGPTMISLRLDLTDGRLLQAGCATPIGCTHPSVRPATSPSDAAAETRQSAPVGPG